MKIRAAVLRESGAAVPYAASRPIKIETLELDEPQQGEVLIKMKAASLCHSDLSVVNGSRPRPLPIVFCKKKVQSIAVYKFVYTA
ncbi:alcohol dehydrogenase catalytic domain-containing protein [Heyndrickxia coagulans]|uniref:alcohol dehydrogenase catalytic domain-containing protein n=1 Tax=Heyndrickxia coagulans TaxID=1398 RepID=UPI0036F441B1